jgi:Lipocalin-like domain
LGYERRRDWRAARRTGSKSCGAVVYTPERVTFLILKNHRKPPERLPPSDEEKIALYDTMFAYSGSYTVESDQVIHHVDMSWNEAWSGTEQVRYCTVDDHSLIPQPLLKIRSTGARLSTR